MGLDAHSDASRSPSLLVAQRVWQSLALLPPDCATGPLPRLKVACV
jgi:hypothetical protein